MIQLINVSKSYNKRLLFKNANINIDKVGIYSFIGENGSGKTTLLNIISRFIKPTKGKIINKGKCSFISQKVKLINHLKIKDHFKMFKIDINVLKKVRLFHKLDSYPSQLSEGQRQRVVCLLAIYSNSSILIADEPTSHLDSKSANLIIKQLIKVSKTKIVLLVSHDLDLVKKHSNQIYKIENNKLKLIYDNMSEKQVETRNKMKFKFSQYINRSLKYHKKINGIFSLIFVISFILLLFGFNFKSNVDCLLDESRNSSLDYNKFYVKQCDEVEKEIIFKKCYNLDEEKLTILKNSEHKVGYNYDLLLNSLYDSNMFNVVSVTDCILKEGRYPSKYNEIIVNGKYNVGDVITLNSSKVLTLDKTDIYNNELSLEVVGITSDSLINKEKFYLDYDLMEMYLKNEYLINNKKTLYDYFESNDLNDYKYVVFFKSVDLSLLEKNDIEFVSSSYEYYESIEEIVFQINECLIYLNIIIIFFSLYYLTRLLNKKIKSKENEILFLKSMGVTIKKITKIINKEQKKLIVFSYLVGCVLIGSLFYAFFQRVNFEIISFFLIPISVLMINKSIAKKAIKKRMSI